MNDWTPFALAVGHATNEAGATGCTVVRGVEGAFRAAVAVVGRATGTRELETLAPSHVADRCDAILLTGGSAYGLDAAAGVMRWMEERGRGFAIGGGVVPIVPAAVVFDLAPLGSPRARPTPEMAYAACDAARAIGVEEGSVGAGAGATVGKALGPQYAMKGGVGCWTAAADAGGRAVGALAVVNALGDVRDGDGRIVAGARGRDGRFLDVARTLRGGAEPSLRMAATTASATSGATHHTTLAVLATDAPMERTALAQLARAAAAALTRRITPAGTSFDGDVVFAACPHPGAAPPPALAAAELLALEARAAWALEMAIERAVRTARGREGVRGLADTPQERDR